MDGSRCGWNDARVSCSSGAAVRRPSRLTIDRSILVSDLVAGAICCLVVAQSLAALVPWIEFIVPASLYYAWVVPRRYRSNLTELAAWSVPLLFGAVLFGCIAWSIGDGVGADRSWTSLPGIVLLFAPYSLVGVVVWQALALALRRTPLARPADRSGGSIGA